MLKHHICFLFIFKKYHLQGIGLVERSTVCHFEIDLTGCWSRRYIPCVFLVFIKKNVFLKNQFCRYDFLQKKTTKNIADTTFCKKIVVFMVVGVSVVLVGGLQRTPFESTV